MPDPVRRVLDQLERVKRSGDGWNARCPAHDDTHPSLSVAQGSDGRALIKCHAGCDTEQVVTALGLKMSDLFLHDDRDGGGFTVEDYARLKRLPADWLRETFDIRTREDGEVEIPYHDETGSAVCARYRTADQFRWGKGATPTLYNLDRLPEPGSDLLLVEGESDVHVLTHHGIAAVGVPGANTWRSEWAAHLEGFDVYVWQEPDRGGTTLVQGVAADLPNARVIQPPDDAPDPAELHAADPEAFQDRLHELVQGARLIKEVVDVLSNDPSDSHDEDVSHRGEPGTRVLPPPKRPMGVARAFVEAQYTNSDGAQLLRDFRGDFYRYDGICWPEAEERIVRARAYRWLEDAVYWKETKTGPELTSWDPTRHKISNLIDALRAVVLLEGDTPPVWTDGRSDPPAPEVVSMENGILHLPSRTLYDHTPRFFTHHSLPFSFKPEAPEPERWLAFLNELWEHDPSAVRCLQEVFGYILGGDTRQQKIFLLVGPKRAGKGTIGRVLTGLLGEHNVAAPTLASFQQNFGLQPLIGKPLALISDARLSGRSSRSVVVERLLSISGEDSLTIDRKYRDPWTGRLPTRLLMLTNELPKLSDSSGALASRFLILVLKKSFYGREDPHLTEKLLTEAPSIFNWALEGLDRLNERGHFQAPKSGQEAVQRLEDLSSPVSAFVRDRCVVGPDRSVPVDDLWQAWKQWCESENQRPGTKTVFGKDLRAAVPTVDRTQPRDPEGDGRIPTYTGIGLKVNPWSGEVPSP